MMVAVDVDLAMFHTTDGEPLALAAEGVREMADFTVYAGLTETDRAGITQELLDSGFGQWR